MIDPDDGKDPGPRRGSPKEPRDDSTDRRARTVMNIVAVGLLLTLLLMNVFTSSPPSVPYYAFKQLVRDGRIDEVQIGSERIRGRYRPRNAQPTTPSPQPQAQPHAAPTGLFARSTRMDFETLRVEDPQLLPLLEEKAVKFSGMSESNPLFTIFMYGLLLFGLVYLWRAAAQRLQNQAGSILAFGRNRSKAIEEDEVKVRFDDVAGVEEAKEELREVVQFLRSPEKFVRIGAKIPKGVLLVGPPGTGKTLLAKAVAGEAGVPFYSISGSEFVEMFVGVGAARVRDLFENAQSHAPCIVFIDELDALGRSRGSNVLGTNEEREQTLNQLLVEMDGFAVNKGVIVLGATNRPEILDPALLRPGRFDRQVLVDRPDRKGREAILRVHARGVKLSTDVDLADVAARTPGFAGADLANVINEAALLAARRERTEVHREEIAEAIDRVTAGLERKSRIISPEERKRVAYHEVGHAIVGELMPGGSKVARISIVPRGLSALGYTIKLPTEDRYLVTESELHAQLAGLLGGRVAEQIVFHEVSTGAGNDLERATELARAMVVDYGMSAAVGPVALGHERGSPFLPSAEGARAREHGAQVGDLVDSEVKRIVEAAESVARELLTARRDQLESIAKALIEREYMDGAEFRDLLDAKPPTADQEAAA